MSLVRSFVVAVFLLAGAGARAEQVRSLATARASLSAFVETIASARRSVELTTFSFEPCDASVVLIARELRAAAARGVRVRVLLDAHEAREHRTLPNIAADFRAAGVEFKAYNDVPGFLIAGNHRTHAKLLVADDSTVLIGGRNLSDHYFSLSAGFNFVDQDFLIRGRSAKEARAAFDEMWVSNLASSVSSGPFVAWERFCRARPARPARSARPAASAMKSLLTDSSGKAFHASAVVHECADVEFFVDRPGFLDSEYGPDRFSDGGGNEPFMTPMRLRMKRSSAAFLEFLNGARRSVEIMNWGYIPVGAVADAFAGLRERRIPVQVLTNGDPEEDKLAYRAALHLLEIAATRDSVGSQSVLLLSRRGAMSDKHALTPAGTPFNIHGKVAVRDGRDVLAGSFNIDPRSFETNHESLVVVRNCPSLVREIESRLDVLRRFYAEDVKRGISKPQKPGLLDRAFAFIAFHFL